MDPTTSKTIETGKTCWKVATANHGAFIVGGQDYFKAFRQSVLKARQRVCLLAWDFNSEIELVRDGEDDGWPSKLGEFLLAVLEARPQLEIYILVWDFAVIYATEREWNVFPHSLAARHERLHLRNDDQLPIGASHHQKAVIIDDQMGFCGGLDLSAWRWDSSEHLAEDKRRQDPDGKIYTPYHDLQLAMTGPAAQVLGELFYYRWKRATQTALTPCSVSKDSTTLWPDLINVDFQNCSMAFSRTYAEFDPEPAVQEIEQLHLLAISEAKNYIYFENQYFSSKRIAKAMIRQLKEPKGPEIVIVMTQDTGGWVEENTMGLLRDRLFEELKESDEHGRLRIYYPLARDEGLSNQVYVHAKLFIVDDRWVKVGSSNLSNRSMRVDSELDVTMDFENEPTIARNFLNRLLGIHFGCDGDQIEAIRQKHKSLAGSLDELVSHEGHSLQTFEFQLSSALDRKLTDTQLLDPDEPIDPSGYIRRTLPPEVREKATTRLTLAVILALLVGAIIIAFQQGWLGNVNQSEIVQLLERFKDLPYAPGALILIHLGAGLIGVPTNLILIASMAFMGPWVALGCGLLGAQISAISGFWIGHWLGKPILKRVTPNQLEKLNRVLGQHGPLSVALVRLIPVAPFVVVNLVAGASSLKFRVFNIGSVLGMVPGMSVIVLMTHQLQVAMRRPTWTNILEFSLYLALAVGVLFFLKKALGIRRRSAPSSKDPAEDKH